MGGNFSLGLLFSTLLFISTANADSGSGSLPSEYTELNDFVVPAPNQGETNTCLFQASTGVMELLLSKRLNIRNPQPLGETDLSERYLISESSSSRSRSWFEDAFLKFDSGEAFLQKTVPFFAFTRDGDINNAVWNVPGSFDTAARVRLPKIDTEFLFAVGNKYSRNVLSEMHVTKIKQALIKYRSPIIAVGNDTDYWHVTVITGYDDNKVGDCYELQEGTCRAKGMFYVRDSFGIRLEERSYDWLVRRGNAAAVAGFQEDIARAR